VNADVDLIVSDCASCAAFLKKYPRLFPETDPRHDTAIAMSAKIKDMVEVLNDTEDLTPAQPRPIKITYHDPCHASRGQALVSEPRKVLERVPGVTYVALPESDWCCGGAGSYALSHYHLSQKVLDRKMENLKKTQAQIVVTSCPACMIQLAYGIRKHGLDMKVRHISQIVC